MDHQIDANKFRPDILKGIYLLIALPRDSP
jgi:hypothetical protein